MQKILKSMQSMMNLDAFEKTMKPMTDLLELQRSILESLAQEQTQLSIRLMADALEEARAVSECESMPELIEVYEKFLQKYQKKMAELTKNQTSSWTLVSEETLKICEEKYCRNGKVVGQVIRVINKKSAR